MDLARILASRPLAPKLDPHATLGEDGPCTTRFRPKTRPGTTRRRHSLSPFINYCLRGGFSQKEHYGDGPRTRSLGCKQALRPPPSQKPNSPCTWSGYNRTNPSNQTDGNRIYGLGTGWFAADSRPLTRSIRFLQLSPSPPRAAPTKTTRSLHCGRPLREPARATARSGTGVCSNGSVRPRPRSGGRQPAMAAARRRSGSLRAPPCSSSTATPGRRSW